MKTTPGITLVHRFRSGTKIIGIAVFKGALMIATSSGVYHMKSPRSKPERLKLKTA